MSCDTKGIYDSFQALDGAVWKKNESVNFDFSVSDTLNSHNLFIHIRNNEDYEFSNLFLITELSFPNGRKIVDTLEYEMTDSRGKFLGRGLSTNKESKLFYKEENVFPMSGQYKVSISQAMRRSGKVNGLEELSGVTDVGFRIEKTDKP